MADLISSPITSRAPVVEFTNRFVQPPSNLYVFRDDKLFLRSHSPFPSLGLFLRARLLTPAGEIVTLEYGHTTSSPSRTPLLTTHDIPEGFLVGVTVHTADTIFTRGDVYVVCGITRGGDAPGAITQILAADYIEGVKGPAWPVGPIRSSVEGPGLLAGVEQADSVAGAEFEITIPVRSRVRLISAFFTLVTDATAADRRVTFEYLAGGFVVLTALAQTTQPASTTRFYPLAHWGAPGFAVDDRITVNWPDHVIMSGGDTFRTFTFNMQAGDNYGAPLWLQEEWLQ